MSKEFLFGQEARDKILKGVNIIEKSVGCTLGPRGKTVLIQQPHGFRNTKDGVSCAKASLPLEDPFEDMGARALTEASQKTAQNQGDGTTATVVIGAALVNEGLKLVAAGHKPTDIKKGIDWAVKRVVDELERMSKKVVSPEEVAQVGTISSNGDAEIGAMISEAMQKVGNEGIITLEEGQSVQTQLEITTGYQFDRGFLSQYFINDPDKAQCVLTEPMILLTDKSLNNSAVMLPIMEKFVKSYPGRPLMVMADNVEGEALALLAINSAKGALKACCVKNGGFGDRKKEMLNDIAALTGATVISDEIGLKPENFSVEMLGSAGKVIVTSRTTTIVEGAGTQSAIEARIKSIRAGIANCNSEWDKTKQEERLSRLVGGVAIIRVGAATEAEMKEKKDRTEDALASTKSAVAFGTVPGGGIALLRARRVIDNIEVPQELLYGVKIVYKALVEPIRRIVLNAGCDPSEVIIEVLKVDNPNYGFNALTEKYEDLMVSGVIDSAGCVSSALQNASSIAGLLLTTECLIVTKSDKKDADD